MSIIRSPTLNLIFIKYKIAVVMNYDPFLESSAETEENKQQESTGGNICWSIVSFDMQKHASHINWSFKARVDVICFTETLYKM